jgi:hypothetical protein
MVLALPFVALWGMTGAATANTIAQIISATASILMCRKLLMSHETREKDIL